MCLGIPFPAPSLLVLDYIRLRPVGFSFIFLEAQSFHHRISRYKMFITGLLLAPFRRFSKKCGNRLFRHSTHFPLPSSKNRGREVSGGRESFSFTSSSFYFNFQRFSLEAKLQGNKSIPCRIKGSKREKYGISSGKIFN